MTLLLPGKRLVLPEQASSVTPASPPQRAQAVPPSSRLPKRPTRLAPQAQTTSAGKVQPDAPVDKAEPVGDTFAVMAHLADSVQASGPTPAEEASTMVLPNWRERAGPIA